MNMKKLKIYNLIALSFFCVLLHSELFAEDTLKRNPLVITDRDNISHEQGWQYAKIIYYEYLELLYQIKQSPDESLSNLITYNFHKKIGSIPASLLRYIKIAGDLKKEFGDLSHLNIVEIGGDNGRLCKVLHDIGGFASYTIIDRSINNDLSREYLASQGIQNIAFIDIVHPEMIQKYDLVISNFHFSEKDRAEQSILLDKVIKPTPYGYMTCSELNHLTGSPSISKEEFVNLFYKEDRKGRIVSERPLSYPDSFIITWHPASETHPVLKGKVTLPLSDQPQIGNAISYNFSGGRFGDNLLAYFHAKWIARKYGLPFLYRPFEFSDSLRLDKLDQVYDSDKFIFLTKSKILAENQISNDPASTVFIVPYFPEYGFYNEPYDCHFSYFQVDWEDPEFRQEVIKCLTPKKSIKTVSPPHGYLSVAVHVRNGGKVDTYDLMSVAAPLKFPPNSYYIEQLKRIGRIFQGQPIYVYIFTDHCRPERLVERFSAAVNLPNMTFDCGNGNSEGIDQMLSDFHSLGKFDCLIRPSSNFSIIASVLGDYSLIITPMHADTSGDKISIDEVEIKFKAKHSS